MAGPAPEFLFDFGSPNAYLAHRVIPAIEARTGARFTYVPVLLGGVFKATGNRSPMEAFAGEFRDAHRCSSKRLGRGVEPARGDVGPHGRPAQAKRLSQGDEKSSLPRFPRVHSSDLPRKRRGDLLSDAAGWTRKSAPGSLRFHSFWDSMFQGFWDTSIRRFPWIWRHMRSLQF